jgi:hypothetical protein
MLGRKDKKQR